MDKSGHCGDDTSIHQYRTEVWDNKLYKRSRTFSRENYARTYADVYKEKLELLEWDERNNII